MDLKDLSVAALRCGRQADPYLSFKSMEFQRPTCWRLVPDEEQLRQEHPLGSILQSSGQNGFQRFKHSDAQMRKTGSSPIVSIYLAICWTCVFVGLGNYLAMFWSNYLSSCLLGTCARVFTRTQRTHPLTY